MNVTVTKAPDGVLYITKDGYGELLDKDLKVGGAPTKVGQECTVALVEQPRRPDTPDEIVTVVQFSFVDYLDTANRDVPGDGVRATWEREVPGRFDFGPYTVEVE